MTTSRNTSPRSRYNRNMQELLVYEETSSDINIQVTPIFVDEESDPEEAKYLWAYQIRIENQSSEVLQLTNRHWEITDGSGFVQEIDGEGVVGELPILKVGGAFEYTSSVVLSTPSGFMGGCYRMRKVANDDHFDVAIPAFSLDSPYASCAIN